MMSDTDRSVPCVTAWMLVILLHPLSVTFAYLEIGKGRHDVVGSTSEGLSLFQGMGAG